MILPVSYTHLDNVLNVRTAIGTKLNELDALDVAGTDRDLQYSQSLSDLQDLDYTCLLYTSRCV